MQKSRRQPQWSEPVHRFRKQKSCCHVIAISQAGIAVPTLTVMQGFEAKKDWQYAGTGKETHGAIFFASKPCFIFASKRCKILKQYAGTGKETHSAIFFCFKTLHYIQLGLGQRCQPEGEQLRGSSFFAYESDVQLHFIVAACVTSAWLASRFFWQTPAPIRHRNFTTTLRSKILRDKNTLRRQIRTNCHIS